jgi:hypothetical protein
MNSEYLEKWNNILADVEKNKIPVQFIKKLVLKLEGKRQQTINIQKLLEQGLDTEQLEEAVSRKLADLQDRITSVEFILDIQTIAETVQPETDELLKNL